MRLLAAALVASVLLPASAVARDKVTRIVEVRVTVTGSVFSDYPPEPPPETTAIGPYGNYSANWNWTQVQTTTYRRTSAKRGGDEYADRTVIESTSTLNETSTVVYRSGTGKGNPSCDDPSVRNPTTVTERKVEKNRAADPPDRRYPYTVVAQVQPTTCGGADHGAGGSFPGAGLEKICLWTCTLPAGKRTHSGSVPREASGGLGPHEHGGSFTASVAVSTTRPGTDKEVRHRWQADF